MDIAQSARETKNMKGSMRHFISATIGIVLGLVCVEVILWTLGSIYRSGQNQKILANDASLYRIVAIGESTSAPTNEPAWPGLLELELNRRAGKPMFRVYNLAVSGTNTEMIVDRLPRDLAMFHPHMVISMMGINDIKYFALPPQREKIIKITDLRIYKLVSILIRIVKSAQEKTFVTQAVSCSGRNALGSDVWTSEYLPRYESILETLYPPQYNGQYGQAKGDKEAEAVLTSFLRTYPFSYPSYEVIVRHYAERSDWKNVVRWADTTQRMFPYIRLCISANPSVSDAVQDTQLRHLGDIENEIISLGNIAQKSIRETRPEITFYEQIRAILGISQGAANIDTKKNYLALARILADQNIQYVAMQYPLLPIADISKLLEGVSNITYISNEDNFQEELKNRPYHEVFTDNFAGVFGHTTILGSQMIASGAADVILKTVQ